MKRRMLTTAYYLMRLYPIWWWRPYAEAGNCHLQPYPCVRLFLLELDAALGSDQWYRNHLVGKYLGWSLCITFWLKIDFGEISAPRHNWILYPWGRSVGDGVNAKPLEPWQGYMVGWEDFKFSSYKDNFTFDLMGASVVVHGYKPTCSFCYGINVSATWVCWRQLTWAITVWSFSKSSPWRKLQGFQKLLK